MPRPPQDSFDEDNESFDPNSIDSVDEFDDASADSATIACPKCGREISEYAEQCPRCKTYLSEEDGAPARGKRPLWIIIGLILTLITALTFLLH